MDNPKAQMFPAGSYVNLLRVAHSPAEVYLTFAQSSPGKSAAAHLLSSLVTTPMHAKAMLGALASTIERYEEQYGEIPVIEPPSGSEVPENGRKRSASKSG